MRVQARDVTVADLGLAPSPPRSTDRVHVSTLIKRIVRALEPERFSGEIQEVRIELGFTLEKVIESAWASRRRDVFRPGEIEKDGIVGSPDAISVDDEGLIVEEVKCTWLSSRGCPEDQRFWHWLIQIRAYCWLVETCRARLHAFFVNGDYREHREPQYLAWDLLFTESELAENWLMLLNQKQAGE